MEPWPRIVFNDPWTSNEGLLWMATYELFFNMGLIKLVVDKQAN